MKHTRFRRVECEERPVLFNMSASQEDIFSEIEISDEELSPQKESSSQEDIITLSSESTESAESDSENNKKHTETGKLCEFEIIPSKRITL